MNIINKIKIQKGFYVVSEIKKETNQLYFERSFFTLSNVYMEDEILTLVKPSQYLKDDVMNYRKEHLDFGESSIYGCAGLIYYTCLLYTSDAADEEFAV